MSNIIYTFFFAIITSMLVFFLLALAIGYPVAGNSVFLFLLILSILALAEAVRGTGKEIVKAIKEGKE